jgi:hypothetical protein
VNSGDIYLTRETRKNHRQDRINVARSYLKILWYAVGGFLDG